jgi:hypothetical protein
MIHSSMTRASDEFINQKALSVGASPVTSEERRATQICQTASRRALKRVMNGMSGKWRPGEYSEPASWAQNFTRSLSLEN